MAARPGRMGGASYEFGIHVHTAAFKMDSHQGPTVALGALRDAMWQLG